MSDQAALSNRASEHHLRSLVKGVSWRFIGSLDTFVLSLLVTGNAKWSVSIASIEALTKIALYYFHERGWERLHWGREAEAHWRSVAKGASWRVVATLDTFMLSWLVTGSVKTAGTIASFEILTKIALFYLHERGWKLIPWGR
ncbi:DUF2061 domain-containing protein [Phenylobacterium aquaticum]|uniref:DUF2061 domain-containing protein n=1 Tax=Phenylobacterium aquaticum TaxID=1763816 RepID=UPI001F5C10E2|nr:DUF2061 domain-containing protein [Phenylobacterium aquaticum]MCI3135329.1 DUF2061 domain-containing protein [Phenylobacterium aquaticum]